MSLRGGGFAAGPDLGPPGAIFFIEEFSVLLLKLSDALGEGIGLLAEGLGFSLFLHKAFGVLGKEIAVKAELKLELHLLALDTADLFIGSFERAEETFLNQFLNSGEKNRV